jgi:hypothetical protein
LKISRRRKILNSVCGNVSMRKEEFFTSFWIFRGNFTTKCDDGSSLGLSSWDYNWFEINKLKIHLKFLPVSKNNSFLIFFNCYFLFS